VLVRYIVQRIALLVPLVIGVTMLVFSLSRFAPGDPVYAALGLDYTPAQAQKMRHELGLDQGIVTQYLTWAGNAARGRLGRSIVLNSSVQSVIAQRGPTTALLAVFAVGMALVVSVPLGVIAAIWKDSWVDNLLRAVAVVGASMPVFWLGLLLLMLLAVRLHWFPAGGGLADYGLRALVLPAITLAVSFSALIVRMVRSMMLEVLGQDYIRTARAKGLGGIALYGRHALRNALIPVVTVVGLQFGLVLGGAVLTETIFNVPGLGRLLIESVTRRDYPLIQGVVLVTAMTFICVNLVVDLLYMVLNPQVRYG